MELSEILGEVSKLSESDIKYIAFGVEQLLQKKKKERITSGKTNATMYKPKGRTKRPIRPASQK